MMSKRSLMFGIFNTGQHGRIN